MDKLSYALGIGIGTQLRDLGASQLVAEDFAQAVKDMIDGRQPAINQQEAQTLVNQFIQEAETRKHAEMAAKGAKVKAEGEDFLKANQTAEGVITLPSGLKY